MLPTNQATYISLPPFPFPLSPFPSSPPPSSNKKSMHLYINVNQTKKNSLRRLRPPPHDQHPVRVPGPLDGHERLHAGARHAGGARPGARGLVRGAGRARPRARPPREAPPRAGAVPPRLVGPAAAGPRGGPARAGEAREGREDRWVGEWEGEGEGGRGGWRGEGSREGGGPVTVVVVKGVERRGEERGWMLFLIHPSIYLSIYPVWCGYVHMWRLVSAYIYSCFRFCGGRMGV